MQQETAAQTVALLNPPLLVEKILGSLKEAAGSSSSLPQNKKTKQVAEGEGNPFEPAPTVQKIPGEAPEHIKSCADTKDFFSLKAQLPSGTPTERHNEEVRKPTGSVESPGAPQERIELKEDPDNAEALLQRLIEAKISGELVSRPDIFSQENEKVKKAARRSGDKPAAKSDADKRKAAFELHKFKSILQNNVAVTTVIFLALFICAAAAIFCFPSFHPSKPASVQQQLLPFVLSGKYSYVFQDRGKTFGPNSFVIRQNGNRLEGEGIDTGAQSKRSFHLNGHISQDRISLLKTYDKRLLSMAPSSALVYDARVTLLTDGRKALSGLWYYKNGLKESVKQTWQASSAFGASEETAFKKSNRLLDFFWNESETLPARFIKILFASVLFGLTVVQISVKFFGMHGLLNHWERENYIPHTVKPKHRALLKELSAADKKGSLPLGTRADKTWRILLGEQRLCLADTRRKRSPHLLVLGAGAKGKTRLLAAMALSDIKNADRAVVIVDSDGSLADLVMRSICSAPEAGHLIDRVKVIDPCRAESISYNPLKISNAPNLQAVASAVLAGFKAVYTESQNQQNQWTQQSSEILRTSVILLMLNNRNLADLPLLLSDNDFRDIQLETLEKNHAGEWKTLIDAWSKHKKLARTEQWLNWIEPILNRVQPLLSDRRIAELLNSEQNSLDLSKLIQEKQVLIVRVPTGQLEKGGQLLGALIVQGLKQAAYMHYERKGQACQDTALYLDEMSSFMDAEAFESICSDTRKVSIGIHASLKTLQNLPEDYRNKVILNFGAMALFAVSKKDAEQLGPGMFRVDGRKRSKINLRDILNPVNSTPQLQFVSDEEKLNINRLVGQEERCYFLHLVGTEAGVFKVRAPEFKDIPQAELNEELMDRLYESEESWPEEDTEED